MIMETEITLEEAFAKLDEITKKMESGSLSLEENFALYKEGLELTRLCCAKIERVETEIRLLNEQGGADE